MAKKKYVLRITEVMVTDDEFGCDLDCKLLMLRKDQMGMVCHCMLSDEDLTALDGTPASLGRTATCCGNEIRCEGVPH